MSLHPVLEDKLNLAVEPGAGASWTLRDARLPAVPGKVHAVTGMRRAGKTVFLHQLLEERRRTVAPERAIYLNFEDERLAGLGVEQLSFLLEEYFRRYPELRQRETAYWYLDEIQLVPGWERFVRRVMDSERIEIVVSGSSARMLSREVHTSLRGRGMETVIRPFSFREYLRHRNEEPTKEVNYWTTAERSRIERRFLDFLVQGGFPESQGLPDPLRIELLQGYVDSVLFRDVVERHNVTQVAALRWITRHCLRNPAGGISVHRLYRGLRSQGHGIAKDTVHALLGHLTDAFLFSTVPLATESERQRNSNPRKAYPADPGFIGAFDPSGRSNIGHALETAVLNEIERQRAEVGYVRTSDGLEVDFLVHRLGTDPELIQVCADPGDEKTRARELRALAVAAEESHPKATKRLLVLSREQLQHFDGTDIEVQPAYEWLLDESAGDGSMRK
jgi:predicted AAA+ superfamily ATPase